MKTFFRNLVDMNSTLNSKIFLGLMFSFVTILFLFLKVFWLKDLPMEVLYFSGGLMCSLFGLGIVTKNPTN